MWAGLLSLVALASLGPEEGPWIHSWAQTRNEFTPESSQRGQGHPAANTVPWGGLHHPQCTIWKGIYTVQDVTQLWTQIPDQLLTSHVTGQITSLSICTFICKMVLMTVSSSPWNTAFKLTNNLIPINPQLKVVVTCEQLTSNGIYCFTNFWNHNWRIANFTIFYCIVLSFDTKLCTITITI